MQRLRKSGSRISTGATGTLYASTAHAGRPPSGRKRSFRGPGQFAYSAFARGGNARSGCLRFSLTRNEVARPAVAALYLARNLIPLRKPRARCSEICAAHTCATGAIDISLGPRPPGIIATLIRVGSSNRLLDSGAQRPRLARVGLLRCRPRSSVIASGIQRRQVSPEGSAQRRNPP